MSYVDFTIDSLSSDFGLEFETIELFEDLRPLPVPDWLKDALARGSRQFPQSEKARSEFIVAPVLLACQEQANGPVSIESGVRLDIDPSRGLVGECDFLLSSTAPLPGLCAPLLAIVGAKKHNIEAGIKQ